MPFQKIHTPIYFKIIESLGQFSIVLNKKKFLYSACESLQHGYVKCENLLYEY